MAIELKVITRSWHAAKTNAKNPKRATAVKTRTIPKCFQLVQERQQPECKKHEAGIIQGATKNSDFKKIEGQKSEYHPSTLCDMLENQPIHKVWLLCPQCIK